MKRITIIMELRDDQPNYFVANDVSVYHESVYFFQYIFHKAQMVLHLNLVALSHLLYNHKLTRDKIEWRMSLFYLQQSYYVI